LLAGAIVAVALLVPSLTAFRGERVDMAQARVDESASVLLGIFDLEDVPLQLVRSHDGEASSSLSGQLLLSATAQGQVALEKAFLFASSVPTRLGPTGPITLAMPEDLTAPARFDPVSGEVAVTFPVDVSYRLLDRILGFERIGEDFTVSRSELFDAELTGRIFQDGVFEGSLTLTGLHLQLGAFVAGSAHIDVTGAFELLPTPPPIFRAENRFENCIDVTVQGGAFSDAEVKQILEKAKSILKQAKVTIRRKILPGDKCESVTLAKKVNEGGGGFASHKSQGPNTAIAVGRNVIDTCKAKQPAGSTDADIVGRVLAHEIGHAKSLDQQRGDPPNLMSDCAPNETLTDAQKDSVRKRSKKLPSLELPSLPGGGGGLPGLPGPLTVELESKSFTFTNATGRKVTDLTLTFDKAVEDVTDKDGFEDVAGLGTRTVGLLDYEEIANGAEITITVKGTKGFKVKNCVWTIRTAPLLGGCALPQ